MSTGTLSGITVLDFSTLLPGPLATLILAEAGAQVIKIEKSGSGDEMRAYQPRFGGDSVNFALLNRGKRSVAIDLKQPGAFDRLKPLIASADVLMEQFRPGVMTRLGLSYEAVREINPRIIYCSLTGYGQEGWRAQRAGHDLNFVAESGILGLTSRADGTPALPGVLLADIGGGSYPAVINILLAMRDRDRTGTGCQLDIAMVDNLFPFMYWGLGAGLWPRPDGELVTGGSPRYGVYRTADARFIAAAPLEDHFWERFCSLIGLPAALQDDSIDPEATRRAVIERLVSKSAAQWMEVLGAEDVCCSLVFSLQEALDDPGFVERGLFAPQVASAGRSMSALPVPLAPQFRAERGTRSSPALGEANGLLKE